MANVIKKHLPPTAKVGSLLVALLFSHVLMSYAIAETIVDGGLLVEDTVWSGDVVVSGHVEVDAGVTLELRPATNVTFKLTDDAVGSSSGLTVYGSLKAIGEHDKPIFFRGEENRPGAWQGIVLKTGKGDASIMRFCRVEDAVTGLFGQSAELFAEEITVSGNTTGIKVDTDFKFHLMLSQVTSNATGLLFLQNSEALVERNHISSNTDAGLVLQGSSPEIRGNVVKKNGEVGIACYRGSSPEITDNLIEGQQIGIRAEMMSNPYVAYNEIRENDCGIDLGRMTFVLFEYNIVNSNGVGVYCNYSAYPEIRMNSFLDNERYALDLGPEQSSKVSLMAPFKNRNGEFTSRAGSLKLMKYDKVSGSQISIPVDGDIDASRNWWGEQATIEMKEQGGDANISVIEDYHDQELLDFRGQLYERDRFVYNPWLREPAEGVGRRVTRHDHIAEADR